MFRKKKNIPRPTTDKFIIYINLAYMIPSFGSRNLSYKY